MERHRGFWVDNSGNSSRDLLHASANAGHAPNLPCFQATKEPGRDLSGQHFELWRQLDQMTPPPEFDAWSGFENWKTPACQ